MPLIFVALVKLVDFAAREVIGNLSMQLFMAFKNTQTSLAEGSASRVNLCEAFVG